MGLAVRIFIFSVSSSRSDVFYDMKNPYEPGIYASGVILEDEFHFVLILCFFSSVFFQKQISR